MIYSGTQRPKEIRAERLAVGHRTRSDLIGECLSAHLHYLKFLAGLKPLRHR